MVLSQSSQTTLDRLAAGQQAKVCDILGQGLELVRLRVMGLCVGQCVHTLRSGARMIVCVGGTRIGLAQEVARSIVVEPLAHPATEPREPAE